jgi:hypothetical protein
MNADFVEVAGGEGPEAAAPAAAPAPAAVPSQSCNNSIGLLSNSRKKMLWTMEQNIIYMAKRYGFNHLLFGTLTPCPKVYEIKEAQRLFNSFGNWVRPRFPDAIVGVHRGKDGFVHFHYVVAAPVDVRTGFDFNAVKRKDYSSVCPWLRREWDAWRKVTNYNGRRDGLHKDARGRTIPAATYAGIGRCELIPIRTTVEQAGGYLSSYIGKGSLTRYEADKGARLVRYWGDSRCVRGPFAWCGPRSWVQRAKMRQCALVEEKCASPEEMREKHGKRWWFYNKEKFARQSLACYPTVKHAQLDGHFFPPDVPHDAILIQIIPSGCTGENIFVLEDTGEGLRTSPVFVAMRHGVVQSTHHEFEQDSTAPLPVDNLEEPWGPELTPVEAQIDENNPF